MNEYISQIISGIGVGRSSQILFREEDRPQNVVAMVVFKHSYHYSYPGHYLSLSLLPPFSYFSVDLLSDFCFNLTSVTWENSNKP